MVTCWALYVRAYKYYYLCSTVPVPTYRALVMLPCLVQSAPYGSNFPLFGNPSISLKTLWDFFSVLLRFLLLAIVFLLGFHPRGFLFWHLSQQPDSWCPGLPQWLHLDDFPLGQSILMCWPSLPRSHNTSCVCWFVLQWVSCHSHHHFFRHHYLQHCALSPLHHLSVGV